MGFFKSAIFQADFVSFFAYILALALASGSAIFPEAALAFTVSLEGSTVTSGWPTSTLSVDMDPSCTSTAAISTALGAAVGVWSGVSTSNLVVSVGTTAALGSAITNYTGNTPSKQYVGNPLIYCDTSFDSDFGFTSPSDIPGLELAPTLNCSSGSTDCPIQGGLVVLNLDASDATNVTHLNASTLAVVVAHELGHALGFGHSSDKDALMYYDATQKTQLRLAQDDVNAVSFLYPRNELGGARIFGCGSVGIAGGTGTFDGRSGGKTSGGRRGLPGPTQSGATQGLLAEFLLLILVLWASTQLAKRSNRASRAPYAYRKFG
jgi:hypothetical protein